MSTQQTFDPYRDWLGVPESNRPLDHYQLLRLKRFEDDPSKVRDNYHKLSTHVRKQLAGKAAPAAHKLLGELTKAMLCLTDAERKGEYDTSLGRAASGDKRPRSFEELLVARKIVDREHLVKAQKFSHVTGVELYDAIAQQKLASAEVVAQIRAEAMGIPYVDLTDVAVDMESVIKLPAVLARQHSILPLLIEHGQVIIASSNPLSPAVEDEVRLRFGIPPRLVLAAPAKLHEAVNKYYSKEAAAKEMGISRPQDTAQQEVQEVGDPVERAKKRQQITMVAAMLTFAAFALGGSSLFGIGLMAAYGSGALAAAIVGGITWKMM